MDSRRWLIDFQCPRCGAAVTLEETERIFSCAFCRVKLCLGTRGPLACCIPPPEIPGGDALFVPYWRMRGMAFTCTAAAIRAGAVDFTHLAIDSKIIPWSLGIQPQLTRLRLVTPDSRGAYLATSLTPDQAIAGYETNMKRLGVPPWTDAALHRSYIGEQTSLLYYPLALRDGKIVDALQGRTYGAAAGWEALIARATPPGIGVGFYAATCPNCGRDLDGDHDTLFLTCGTCDRAWKRAAERLEETTFSAVSGNAREEKFGLPFWRIRVGVEGLSLDSFGEFVRFCNLTRAVPPAMKEKPFYFWVPAFKVNAELFLTLIRRMTLHQWQGEMEQRLGDLACHPATLSAEEGVESLKTAMADLAADKKTFLPKLGTIGIVLKEALLVYFPFRASGGELVRPDIPLGIQKKALQYGLNI